MKFAVVVFPGSNCDHDAYYAARHVLGQDAAFVWHKDATLGGAGHAREMVARLGADGIFLGIDADADAIARAREALNGASARVILEEGNFRFLESYLGKHGIPSIGKALFDKQYDAISGRNDFRSDRHQEIVRILHNSAASVGAWSAITLPNGERAADPVWKDVLRADCAGYGPTHEPASSGAVGPFAQPTISTIVLAPSSLKPSGLPLNAHLAGSASVRLRTSLRERVQLSRVLLPSPFHQGSAGVARRALRYRSLR